MLMPGGRGYYEDGRMRRWRRVGAVLLAIVLAEEGRVLQTFRREVAGETVDEPRGSSGFGYDPYFLYEPFGLIFAEIAPSGSWP